MATQIDGIGVIHLTIAIRPEICGLVDAKIRASENDLPVPSACQVFFSLKSKIR